MSEPNWRALDTSDPWDYFRMLARERYGRVTPWRLGVCVGVAGQDLPSPYARAQTQRIYEAGKAYGRKEREKISEAYDIKDKP